MFDDVSSEFAFAYFSLDAVLGSFRIVFFEGTFLFSSGSVITYACTHCNTYFGGTWETNVTFWL